MKEQQQQLKLDKCKELGNDKRSCSYTKCMGLLAFLRKGE